MIGAFFAGFVWPFYNLIPDYQIESAKVVYNGDDGCMVKTMDNYLVPANGCGDAKPGDFVPIEYDVKIKDRMDAAVRHP